MGVFIRSAIKNDALSVAKVRADSWQITYRGIFPDSYLDDIDYLSQVKKVEKWIMDPESHCVVAVDSNSEDVVGFAIGGKCKEIKSEADGELWAIYLERSYQGQGIGKKLFHNALELLRVAGYKIVLVSVLKENESSVSFYQSQGGRIGPPDCFELLGIQYPTMSFLWDLV